MFLFKIITLRKQRKCMEGNVTMDDPSSKVTVDDNESCINPATSIDQQGYIRKVDCAIIGAGAAGLQCAAILLERRQSSVLSSSPNNIDKNPDIIITNDSDDKISLAVLEARDRIGGRILTTHEKTITVGPNHPVEILLYRDHGAAWVHGAHECNPMIQLLEKLESQDLSATQPTQITTNQPLRVLNPVFEGNPWIRPHMVLHRNGKKGANSLISFFVNGSYIPDNEDGIQEINKEDGNIQKAIVNGPSVTPTSTRSSLSSLAIRRHYRVLREIVSKYNSDEYKCDDHGNFDQLYKQLNSAVDDLSPPTNNTEDEDGKRLISLLSPFYLYLMENWNGISMKETKVEQVLDLLIFDQSLDNEEEMKEGKKEISMPETDEQYTSAGDFIGPHCKVKTGMFTVLKPLIQVIERHHQHEADDILCLGEEVISIIDKTSHVRIEMTSGNIIEAKCCVSTIPLGCLQHLISTQRESTRSKAACNFFFQPKLCDEKIEAINSIWSGSYKKVFLTFDHIFWPKEPPIIGLVRSESVHDLEESSLIFPGRHLLLYNLWARDNNIPSVEAILCGDLGKWAYKKSDAIIQQAVINFIEAAMGLSNLLASCIGCHITRWEEDRFTRGSYSTFQLKTLDRHVEALGSTEWDGRLVFAGEATENDLMGSVHAALISGKRAAEEVLNFLPSSNSK